MAWKRGTPWPIEQIRQWIAAGKTHRWIANELGTADQRISKLCRQHSIEVHRRGPRNGTGHPNWKGGRIVTPKGYVLIYAPGHPRARVVHKSGGYVWEHHLVMEEHIGRFLLPGEVVHHEGAKGDNRISQLVLYQTNGEHLKDELTGRCPKWSDDGKARIREAVRERWRKQRETSSPDPSTSGVQPCSKSIDHS